MAFVHSKDSAGIFVDGTRLQADIRGWTFTCTRNLAETTAVGDEGVKQIPGLFEDNISIDAYFNSAATRIYEIVNANQGVDNGLDIAICPETVASGAVTLFGRCDLEEFEVESSVDEAVQLTFEGAADGMCDIGIVTQGFAAQTVTGSNSGLDNLVATTNGGAGMVHVETVSGTTPTMTVKIQHSVDNSVWVDLLTFDTTFNASGQSERKEVAAGTTVNRYLRTNRTIAGTTPSFSFASMFGRR